MQVVTFPSITSPVVSPVSASPFEATEIGTEELVALRASGRPVVVAEVLPRAYWVAGHIPGAVNMPLDALVATITEKAPTKGAEIVVYCASRSCKSSHTAAAALVSMGYTAVRIYAGGKAEWKDAGLALEVSP